MNFISSAWLTDGVMKSTIAEAILNSKSSESQETNETIVLQSREKALSEFSRTHESLVSED